METYVDNNPVHLADLSITDWIFLGVALLATTFLALGAHDLAIAHLGVPYPHDEAVPGWARYFGQTVRIGSIVLLCHLAAGSLKSRSTAVAALIVGVTIAMLYEAVRVVIITMVVVDGFVGQRWLPVLLDTAPSAIVNFLNGVAALLIARHLIDGRDRAKTWAVAVAVLVVAAVGLLVLPPILKDAADGMKASLHLSDPSEVYHMPYNLYVYRFIYGLFVEPALATFILAYLVWPALPRGVGKRLAAFALLLLFVRGRVVGTALFSLWIPQPAPVAFASEGQFFLETLIMALLTGVAWTIIYRIHRRRRLAA